MKATTELVAAFDPAEYAACDVPIPKVTLPEVGADHVYSPFLWAKRAEKNALGSVKKDHRSVVAPVLMLLPVPKKGAYLGKDAAGRNILGNPPTYKQHLAQQIALLVDVAADAMGFFGKFERLFIDVSLLQSKESGRHVLRDAYGALGANASDYVAMIDVDPRMSDVKTARSWHSQYRSGVAIKLRHGRSWPAIQDIDTTLAGVGCSPTECDIFLDFDSIFGKGVAHLVQPTMGAIMSYAPRTFRRIVITSSAFPPAIGSFPVGHTPVIRKDAVLYLTLLRLLLGKGNAGVWFGDHASLNVKPLEGGGPVDIPPTIRYADDRCWNVYRRKDKREMPLLCQEIIRDFPDAVNRDNAGDRWICEQVSGHASPGMPLTWTFVGLSHHIWFVVKQMNGLS